MTWHLEPVLIDHYLGGRLHEARATSVETHLMTCADCRGQVAAADRTPAQAHERSWAAVAAAVDEEPAGAVERTLGRWLRPDVVRLVAAAPVMRRAWWSAGALLLVTALLAAQLGGTGYGTLLFVVTAPLVPLAGVALAYAGSDDLVGEVAVTTPYSRFRLLLLRTGAVVTATLPVIAVLAAALPVDARLATVWLAPTAALCATTLLLSARWSTRRVAAVLGLAWLAASWLTLRPPRAAPAVEELLDQSALFRPAGQLALVLVAALALAVAVIRRASFENRRTA